MVRVTNRERVAIQDGDALQDGGPTYSSRQPPMGGTSSRCGEPETEGPRSGSKETRGP